MPSITISIDSDVWKILERRAKANLQTFRELVEDILRKSAVRTRLGNSEKQPKIDDKLVAVFSREKRGRKGRRDDY
jgi:hypothetical protein